MCIYEIDSSKLLHRIDLEPGVIYAADLSKRGDFACIGGEGGVVNVYPLNSAENKPKRFSFDTTWVQPKVYLLFIYLNVQFADNNLITVSGDFNFHCYDLIGDKNLFSMEIDMLPSNFVVSPTDPNIVAMSASDCFRMMDLRVGKVVMTHNETNRAER